MPFETRIPGDVWMSRQAGLTFYYQNSLFKSLQPSVSSVLKAGVLRGECIPSLFRFEWLFEVK